METDTIPGGLQQLREQAVPVLFEWNDYTLLPARLSVWDRVQRPEDDTEEEMDVSTLLKCHNYDACPEPSVLDVAIEKMEAQQQINKLQRRLEEVSLKQSFVLERFKASDDDIRFYTRYVSSNKFDKDSFYEPECCVCTAMCIVLYYMVVMYIFYLFYLLL